jgi:hypothetical protein
MQAARKGCAHTHQEGDEEPSGAAAASSASATQYATTGLGPAASGPPARPGGGQGDQHTGGLMHRGLTGSP